MRLTRSGSLVIFNMLKFKNVYIPMFSLMLDTSEGRSFQLYLLKKKILFILQCFYVSEVVPNAEHCKYHRSSVW